MQVEDSSEDAEGEGEDGASSGEDNDDCVVLDIAKPPPPLVDLTSDVEAESDVETEGEEETKEQVKSSLLAAGINQEFHWTVESDWSKADDVTVCVSYFCPPASKPTQVASGVNQ